MFVAKGRMDEGASQVWCKRAKDRADGRVTEFWFFKDIDRAPSCDPSLVVILPRYNPALKTSHEFWCGNYRYMFSVMEDEVRLDCFDVPALYATAAV